VGSGRGGVPGLGGCLRAHARGRRFSRSNGARPRRRSLRGPGTVRRGGGRLPKGLGDPRPAAGRGRPLRPTGLSRARSHPPQALSERRKERLRIMAKLQGKIALITGGNSGIGLATARQFVKEGAYVFITGRRDAELTSAVKEIGTNVTGVRGDVSNLGDLDHLFSQIERDKGRLDIVFANAGVAKYARLGTITEELYNSIFDINVKGLLFTVQ